MLIFPLPLTCMPLILTPRLDDVVVATLAFFRCCLAAESSSAYCLVPIFRSSTHGHWYLWVRFSRRIYSGDSGGRSFRRGRSKVPDGRMMCGCVFSDKMKK